MKKIIIILFLFAAIISLAACTQEEPLPDFRDRMEAIEEPIKSIDGVWMSHQYIINEKETLFFAPDSFRKNGNTYVNLEKKGYYLKTTNFIGMATWERVSNEYVEAIFTEGA